MMVQQKTITAKGQVDAPNMIEASVIDTSLRGIIFC